MSDADVVVGEDGLSRCSWAASSAEYRAYHDAEWARPVGDEDRVYEKLCLEGFQAGLSWLTILRKREGFREAFASFDPVVVASFNEADVERLVADPRIVRHRGKIAAAITNARATLALHDRGDSLAAHVWHYQPTSVREPQRLSDLPSSTPQSTSLSADLRRLGYVFVGPTTVYATMQALGVVNDHLQGCQFRLAAEDERARFIPPDRS